MLGTSHSAKHIFVIVMTKKETSEKPRAGHAHKTFKGINAACNRYRFAIIASKISRSLSAAIDES